MIFIRTEVFKLKAEKIFFLWMIYQYLLLNISLICNANLNEVKRKRATKKSNNNKENNSNYIPLTVS